MPISLMARIASGFTRAGGCVTPEWTSSPASSGFSTPSPIWLRAELPVHSTKMRFHIRGGRDARLFAQQDNRFRLDRLVARAALRIKERQQFLQGFGVGAVAQKVAFPLHLDQTFVLQLI